jgi:flagellar motor switch protein FliN/FliY
MADSTPENAPEVTTAAIAAQRPAATTSKAGLESLTAHGRGLLRIRVPIQLTLASQRKSIQEIIELGPGSIVKFEKTFDEPLELQVNDRTIAHGEVVKVGDKFGVRISGLVK